jgi:glutaconate CoA-transferase subunit B
MNDTRTPTPNELMTVSAARALTGSDVCFVGIGLPSQASNLARLLHAPDLVLIYESGTIGSRPSVLPLSIGDGELAQTADAVVSVPEIFAYWLQGGRVDVGFLGAAQVDRYGNINTTVIGPYSDPTVRLPGGGGAPEIAAHAKQVYLMLKHEPRRFVERIDFVTSTGQLPPGQDRRAAGLTGKGPTRVFTDLGLLEPDPQTNELTLVAVHPGVEVDTVRERTGWDLRVSPDLYTLEPPRADELSTLRDLLRRTEEAQRG